MQFGVVMWRCDHERKHPGVTGERNGDKGYDCGIASVIKASLREAETGGSVVGNKLQMNDLSLGMPAAKRKLFPGNTEGRPSGKWQN